MRLKLLSVIPAAPAVQTLLGSSSPTAYQAGASCSPQRLAQTPGFSVHFATLINHEEVQRRNLLWAFRAH